MNDCQEESPQVDGAKVLDNKGRGVTAAWNLGIKYADTSHVILLNNDVDCNGLFVDRMVKAAGPHNICGAKMRVEPLVRKKVLQGWCLCFSKELWERLGGFDEEMRYYFSDTDLMLRAEHKVQALVAAHVPLVHLGHRTAHDSKVFPKRMKWYNRDLKEFRKRHKRKDI